GSDATHVTDLLVNAVTQGKVAAADFAGSIGRVLPVAAAFGVSLEEVLASMATMTRTGMSADEAATALRQTFINLEKPGAEATKVLKEIGLSASALQAEIKDRGLLNTLQDLMQRTGGNVDAIDLLIPNVRALVGVLSTAGSQGDQYAGILQSMYLAAGRTDEAFGVMNRNVSTQAKELGNNLSVLGIQIGNGLAEKVAGLLERVNDFVRGETFLNWAARAGGVIYAVVDAVGTLAGAFAEAFGAILSIVGTIGHEIYLALQWINPFARHSPSLIENVQSGVAIIKASYGELGEIAGPLDALGAKMEAFGAQSAGMIGTLLADETARKAKDI